MTGTGGMYIDVHGHLAPLGETGGGPPSLRDPESSLATKRALDVGMTIVGSPVGAGSMLPGSGVDNYAQTADQVRAHNERMGELVSRYPDDLRAYAYLDPFGGDDMLAQALDLLRDWRFVGLVVNSSVGGEYLGSSRAADFFAAAAEGGAPVLVHPPAEPIGTSNLGYHHGLVEHIARPCDVTMGIAAIISGGWLEKYPDLALIAAAGGGGLAVLAEKLDLALAGAPALSRPASESLSRVLVETACPSQTQLRANLKAFGASNVLFGSDSPPLLAQLGRIVEIVESPLLTVEERRAVSWANAARLFGLPVSDDAGVAVGRGGGLNNA